MYNILKFAHNVISINVKETDTVVDFTVGNGNDTLFLSKICQKGYVYGFDIQQKAIEETEKLLKNNNINNTTLILDSHENVEKYISKKIKAGIFNLGFLPNSNKLITTKSKSTIKAIIAGLNLLEKGGVIVIVCYTGHNEGLIESQKILSFIESLDKKSYSISKYEMLNKINCPFVISIKSNI